MGVAQPAPYSLHAPRCHAPHRVRWDEQAIETYSRESVKVLAVTWNVGESKPGSSSSFFRWLKETAFGSQVAVVALQEIEMGSSSGEGCTLGRCQCCSRR